MLIAPIRSPAKRFEFAIWRPRSDDGFQNADTSTEEAFSEIVDNITDIHVGAVVDPHNRLFMADRSDSHQVHGGVYLY